MAYNDQVPIHKSITIHSRFVGEERVINIWMPPGYEDGGKAFPVLYMPDGGIGEDFPHIANTLSELITSNKIEPVLLVGIENTERGRDLTGESKVDAHEKYGIPMADGAKNFRAFILEELVPEIERNYQTTGEKGIIGESLAGLFVVETFLLQPGAFEFYIAMDPSLWWNDNFLVKNAAAYLTEVPDGSRKLWFAGSNTTDIFEYTRQFAELLEREQPKGLDWKYSDEPDEKHHTIFRGTKEQALIWTLGR
ncbi:MAG: alpha/beta hydrolase [Phaeodactylibacter xiamenensis]|nr:alpha/beta hydrolase-fold protein [Phaeodactylibacter xiamenensis]MCR9051259.1 alpha/beta hydrolase-fold protein [bacterium]